MIEFKKKLKTIAYVVFFVVFSFNQESQAKDLQKFSKKNNDTVLVVISQKELSRFVFKGDRVKQIFSTSGELHHEIRDGSLYVKPNAKKPINFFVSTENGNTYKIIATSKDIPAVQIFISAVGVNSKKKQFFTSESVYTEGLAKIIKVILSSDERLGYDIKKIGKSYKAKNDLRGYLDSQWSGDGFVGEKHFLFNRSDKPIKIDRRSYLTNEVEAIYIDREVVGPRSSAILIKVRAL